MIGQELGGFRLEREIGVDAGQVNRSAPNGLFRAA
jgi:hypothetical protein